MKSWPLFLELQTTIPYGDGVSTSTPNERSVSDAGQWIARMREWHPFDRALVVGPGGIPEAQALKKVLGDTTLHALSPHLPEIKMLNDSGLAFAELGDMHYMPYQSATFDFVYSANVLEHAFAPYVALMETRRVMRDRALAYFMMPQFDGPDGGVGPFHLHCLDAKVWKELLCKTGFVITEVSYEPGGSGQGGYHHFRCVTGDPPGPHKVMLNRLVSFRAS